MCVPGLCAAGVTGLSPPGDRSLFRGFVTGRFALLLGVTVLKLTG